MSFNNLEAPDKAVARWVAKQGISPRKNAIALAHKAAGAGMISVLEWMKRSGVDIHAPVESGKTLMREAIKGGRVHVMNWLLVNGVNDLQLRSAEGWALIHHAVWGNDPMASMIWLVRQGVDIEARTDKGFTPAILAAKLGNLTVLKWLAERGADLMVHDNEGSTLMHEAAQRAHLRAMEWLFAQGSDIHSRDAQGRTPLHRAAATGPRLFSETGTFHDTLIWLKEQGVDLDAKDNCGRTPLRLARESRNMLAHLGVTWLIELGAKDDEIEEPGPSSTPPPAADNGSGFFFSIP